MELDKRIKEGKRPLTCFDLKEAEKFEGKEGYFSDRPRDFADGEISIEQCATKGILELDERSDNDPYINKTTCLNYPYFLPAEWVKPEEQKKQYRPYSLELWTRHYDIGEIIHFRHKDSKVQHRMMLTGYTTEDGTDMTTNGMGTINLGGFLYSFQTLFESYEIMIDDEWQPFGVLDNGDKDKE